jgi:hypothetical protein
MSSANLEALRTAIRNEGLPLPERKTAAEHYTGALVDAVQEPSDDHPEVIALRTPASADGPLGDIYPWARAISNEACGWAASGPTLPQAVRHVHERLRLRALLAVIVDEAAHLLERLEAFRRVLVDHLDPHGFYRKNQYDPEKMLSKVLPATATKYGGWNKQPVPVVRPPHDLADVW